jgi:hypothetical protein
MDKETLRKVQLDIRNGEEISALGVDIEPDDYYGGDLEDSEYDYNSWKYSDDDYTPPKTPTVSEQEQTAQALSLLARIKGGNRSYQEDWSVE